MLILLVGCGYDPQVGEQPPTDGPPDATPDAAATRFTLFVADFGRNAVHRYALEDSDASPTSNFTITLAGAVSPFANTSSDELLVGEVGTAVIARFSAPLAQPTSAGVISSGGLRANMGKMTLVDDELFVVNQAGSNVLRYTFDGNGQATQTGEIPNVIAGRGIVFDKVRRNLYVTQCCGADAILQFGVDAMGKVQSKSTTTGAALSSPHGLLVTPWGELFVVNAASNAIRRFTLAANGQPIPGDEISGNGLNLPIDVVMTPWEEIYVTNGNAGTISRFAFDANHTASPHGNLVVPNAMQVVWETLDLR